jgi:hypothetical protein
MLVGANDGGVAGYFRAPGLLGQSREDPLPAPGRRPAGKALVCAIPAPELLGQIAPRAAGACNPQHRLDEQAVIGGFPAALSGSPWQHRLDTFPLLIA